MIAFGLACTWWDDLSKAARREPDQRPVCPVCGKLVYTLGEEAWNEVIGAHVLEMWARGRCFRTWMEARETMVIETAVDETLLAFPDLDRGKMIEWTRAIRARREGGGTK